MQSGTLDLGRWTLTPEWVSAYLKATCQEDDAGETVPPLALAARALAGLLETLELPGGAVHGGQEVECQRAAYVGEEIHITAEVGRPSQRGDFRFIIAGFTVRGAAEDTILTGKCTVILPRSAQ